MIWDLKIRIIFHLPEQLISNRILHFQFNLSPLCFAFVLLFSSQFPHHKGGTTIVASSQCNNRYLYDIIANNFIGPIISIYLANYTYMYWFMLVTNTLLSLSMFSLKIYTFSLLFVNYWFKQWVHTLKMHQQ